MQRCVAAYIKNTDNAFTVLSVFSVCDITRIAKQPEESCMIM